MNSLVAGLLANSMEDWTSMDGTSVQRERALYVSIGSFAATVLIIPLGKCIDHLSPMVVITFACLGFAGFYSSLVLVPA